MYARKKKWICKDCCQSSKVSVSMLIKPLCFVECVHACHLAIGITILNHLPSLCAQSLYASKTNSWHYSCVCVCFLPYPHRSCKGYTQRNCIFKTPFTAHVAWKQTAVLLAHLECFSNYPKHQVRAGHASLGKVWITDLESIRKTEAQTNHQ